MVKTRRRYVKNKDDRIILRKPIEISQPEQY